jgi:hypothetical protein
MLRSGWRAIAFALMGAVSASRLEAGCDATIRVGADHNQGEIDQVILLDVADRLDWCLIWDGRETNITRRLAMIRDGDLDLIYDASRMLLIHHGDVFISPVAFSSFLGQQGETGIVALDWQPYRAPVYYMFSRKTISADQMKQFNRALASVLRKQKTH